MDVLPSLVVCHAGNGNYKEQLQQLQQQRQTNVKTYYTISYCTLTHHLGENKTNKW